jgi:hypothetical protein
MGRLSKDAILTLKQYGLLGVDPPIAASRVGTTTVTARKIMGLPPAGRGRKASGNAKQMRSPLTAHPLVASASEKLEEPDEND